MDTQSPVEPTGSLEGPYARRARALLADRADLFVIATPRSSPSAGVGPPEDRQAARDRRAGRQLSLPLPRERVRRRARMLG